MSAIQAVLMPDFKGIGTAWDMASIFLSANELSGDFYSGDLEAPGVYQVAVCDVMEHGAPASHIGMEIRTMAGPAITPAGLLARVNAPLFDDFASIRYYATMAVCRIDLSSGAAVYSSAGHPPALHLLSGAGRVAEIAYAGPIIGLNRQAQYRDHTFIPAPGESLLLHTDGVFEARIAGGDELYGLERLAGISGKTTASRRARCCVP